MKKALLIIVLNCIFLSVSYAQNISTTNQTFTLGQIGTTINVPVNATNISSYGSLFAATIRVEFNTDVLQYLGTANMNGTISSQTVTYMPNGTNGAIQVNVEGFFTYPAGKSFDLQFTYKGGSSSLLITKAEFLDGSFVTQNASVTNGSVSGPTVAITSVANGNWNTAATWNLNQVPNASNHAIIANSTAVIVNADASVGDLTVNTGGLLTVNSGKFLSVNGTTTLNGSQCLVLKSDMTGTASFISNTNAGSGTAKVERYIDGNKWHLFSIPTTTASVGLFAPGVNSNIPIYLRPFDQAANAWSSTYITDVTSSLLPNKGYAIWANSSATIMYNGTLNTTTTLPYTTAGSGWNLLGNPFTSAINWNLVTGKPANNSFYSWNSTSGVYSVSDGTIAANLPSGAPANIIPAMQGFFVKAVAGGSLAIGASKVHNAQLLYKSSNSLGDIIRLTAQRGSFKDEALVTINPAATNNYDEAFDASKLFAYNIDVPEIYTLAGTEEIAINKVGTVPAVIPVNIKMGVADNVTITASDYANFDASVFITLEDMLTGTFQNLRQNPSYTFAATIGENDARFKLHFSYNALQIKESNQSNTSIYSYDKTIYVNSSEKINNISVYNMLGQLIINKEGNSNTLNSIKVQGANAYYIVRVTTVSGVNTKKVFIQ